LAIRVAHFATGDIGKIALRQLIADLRFELHATPAISPGWT
jgi:hypothetical protein